MSQFTTWCAVTKENVNGHEMTLLNAEPKKIDNAVNAVTELIPLQYAEEERIAHLMKNLGKPAVAKYINEKLPRAKKIRSGDLGEILGTFYVKEFTVFNYGVQRLRWKDHPNMSMRGEDLLAFGVDDKGEILILKGEAKSNASLSDATMEAARKALSANNGLPSPHAISFLADRCFEHGQINLADLLDKLQLQQGIKSSQVTHLMFIFSGNNPAQKLRCDLNLCDSSIKQISVGLRVVEHQKFIKLVFDRVTSNGD